MPWGWLATPSSRSGPEPHHFKLAGFLAIDLVGDAAVNATCTAHSLTHVHGDCRNFHAGEADVEVAVLNKAAALAGLALVADQFNLIQKLKPGLGVAVAVDRDAVAALSCDGGADLHLLCVCGVLTPLIRLWHATRQMASHLLKSIPAVVILRLAVPDTEVFD